MKHIFLFISVLFCFSSMGQTMAEKVLKEAKALEAQNKEEEALSKFKMVLAFDINNYESFWNCSLLSAKVGRREVDKEKQKDYYLKAKIYAEKAFVVIFFTSLA